MTYHCQHHQCNYVCVCYINWVVDLQPCITSLGLRTYGRTSSICTGTAVLQCTGKARLAIARRWCCMRVGPDAHVAGEPSPSEDDRMASS